MPAEVFVDSGIWFEAATPKRPAHERSAAVLREAYEEHRQLVTTNLVIAEAHALLLRRVNRHVAWEFLRLVRMAPNTVVASTPELEERAIQGWIQRYDDQDFSLADAVSFAVMAGRGITEALTLDRHFAVAGFTVRPSLARSRRDI